MKKKVDALGRIGIPKRIREDMGLTADSYVSIDYDSNKKCLMLKADIPQCLMCKSTENLLKLKNHVFLCANCLKELNPNRPM